LALAGRSLAKVESMNHVRFEYPSCSPPIETDEATARKGVRCPGCGTSFIPEGFRHEPRRTDQTSPEIELENQCVKIQNKAQGFTGMAVQRLKFINYK
jgi:hypothetical protein